MKLELSFLEEIFKNQNVQYYLIEGFSQKEVFVIRLPYSIIEINDIGVQKIEEKTIKEVKVLLDTLIESNIPYTEGRFPFQHGLTINKVGKFISIKDEHLLDFLEKSAISEDKTFKGLWNIAFDLQNNLKKTLSS
jgi:hypothetical protein